MFNIKEYISELENNRAACAGQFFCHNIQQSIVLESGSQYKTAIARHSSPIFKNNHLIYVGIFNIFSKINLTMTCFDRFVLWIACSAQFLSGGLRYFTVRVASFMVIAGSAGKLIPVNEKGSSFINST